MEVGDGENMDEEETTDVYLPGEPINTSEELVKDDSTYVLYHEAQTGSPCLSFDILRDNLGNNRDEYPLSCYLVCGTQAFHQPNHMIVMKMSNMHRLNKSKDKDIEDDEDSDDSEDSEDDEAIKPKLVPAMIEHHGGVNRIRSTKLGEKHVAATWSERKSVHLWDLSKQIEAVDDADAMDRFLHQRKNATPIFTFGGHLSEGFAMDWSSTGSLLTGDCHRNIHLWTPQDSGSWHVDQLPFAAHTDSVEDIQWSPGEQNVFASCSVDKTIRIWDARASRASACMLTVTAHDKDVNVISWSRNDNFLVSGGDDGIIKVWELRSFQSGSPVAQFKHHTKPITSVEWHPTERGILAAAGADDQITQWDLSVEPDEQAAMDQDVMEGTEDNSVEKLKSVPPNLLFIHQGQTDIKELHWHSQMPGVLISTASSGFNVFRTISV